MITRGKAGISKLRRFLDIIALTSSALHMVLLSQKVPKDFKTTSKHSKWLKAMNVEIQAL